MAKKKWKKQKRKNVRIIAVVLGGILIMMAFVLSLRSLSTPFSDQPQETEAKSHQ